MTQFKFPKIAGRGQVATKYRRGRGIGQNSIIMMCVIGEVQEIIELIMDEV